MTWRTIVSDNLFRGCGVEISLSSPEKFLLIKETLTRIGIASKHESKLYQSVHILHKQSRYVLIHFKELFVLDGRPSAMTEEDYARRNTIASLLQEWGLVSIIDKNLSPLSPLKNITIIPFKEKDRWSLVSKYTIGNKFIPK